MMDDWIVKLLHSRPIPSKETCQAAFKHDGTVEILSVCICVGLVLSYLPQHYRIIHNKSSEGFSPFFLLLGATSSACSLLNIITLQFGQIGCCKYLTAGQCFESVLGIAQVTLQWFCFSLIFVLYLFFYPLTSKYVRSLPLESASIPTRTILPSSFTSFFTTTTPTTSSQQQPPRRSSASSAASDATSNSSFDPRSVLLPGALGRHSTVSLSPEYRLSLSLFLLTSLHLFLSSLLTIILLSTLPTSPPTSSGPESGGGREHPSETAVRVWAATLGIGSVLLGCMQYLPQIALTLRRKTVGSLSIPMMCLQVPGSFVFVYTLAVRPGVDWTGYATYLITGILQSVLLVTCLLWRKRQAALGIDDWGKSLDGMDGEAESERGERSRLLD